LLRLRQQQVERHRENRVDQNQQAVDEPSRTPVLVVNAATTTA
jgi:hypothetical protein